MTDKEPKKIDTRISIIATYDRGITIELYDNDAGIMFAEVHLTKEQFVDAALNRLGRCNTEGTIVRDLDHVGMMQEHKRFIFEISKSHDDKYALENVEKLCPKGWTPDMQFSSQGSFFEEDGKRFAATFIRRWVKKPCS